MSGNCQCLAANCGLRIETYRNGKARRHSVKVVGVRSHCHHLRNNGLASPLHSEDLRKLLQVVRGGFSDREDRVTKPAHAEPTQLLIEKLHSQLAGKQGNVLNDSEPYSPLLIFSELNDGRE